MTNNTEQPDFQRRVQPWMLECFGPEIAADAQERNHRFLEESLELVQACGATQSEAHQLVDYVYGRPVGDKSQEAGGVMVTLAALCLAQGLDMHTSGETELTRIWTKVDQIRAKQAAKPKHSPLPEHVQPASMSSEPILPPMPNPVIKHPKLGALFDRLQMHFYAVKHAEGMARLLDACAASTSKPATADDQQAQAEAWLSYVDPECMSQQDKALHLASGFRAGQAYNELCMLIGGRFPDSMIENEAPTAHKFFMHLFGSAAPAALSPESKP